MAKKVAVVGSGPNGLGAAIELARSGFEVTVLEAKSSVGGGTRTEELTLPEFHHDVCSAIHPMALASFFFQSLPLEKHGLEWIYPEVAVAHPLEDGEVVLLHTSIEETADQFEASDRKNYLHMMGYLNRHADKIFKGAMGPLRIPRNPWVMMRFGWWAFRSAQSVVRSYFSGTKAKALFAGNAGHSILPFDHRLSAAIGWMLQLAGHSVGWPFPKGGAQSIAFAMQRYLEELGGKVVLNHPVADIRELETFDLILLDTNPKTALEIVGEKFSPSFRKTLEKFQFGPGVYKIDWALKEAMPWKNSECLRSATVHIGGTFEEIATSEKAVSEGKHPAKPYVLFAQQSLMDPSRSPETQHTGWAYCHVPNGSTQCMRKEIEDQIERFAPGFRDIVLSRHEMNCQDFEHYNANYLGGDIIGGAMTLPQLFTRPSRQLNPYRTSHPAIYFCSSSTPPGGGVHGLCGYYAALQVKRNFG